jgi:LCP family protein required for cell wall assembly
VSFTKSSLKSRQRKKRIRHLTKKTKVLLGFADAFSFTSLLFVPRLFRKFFQKKDRHYPKAKILFGLFFVFFAFLIGVVGSSDPGQQAAKNVVKSGIFALGAELPKDSNGHTNILLLGSGGGEAHAGKGHKLTDSIMIASLDFDGRSVVMLSLPRDFYVETEHVRGRINEIIRDESKYILNNKIKTQTPNKDQLKTLSGQERLEFLWKMEALADEMATDILKEKIKEIFQIEIHRTARIDFRGFEKLIDAIGGIEVEVEKTIDDPTYPDFDWGFDPFYLEAGVHSLDGSTALKYARSRHGTSDFDRAKRQQKVLSAIKEKMTSLRTLTNFSRLEDIFLVVQENYISDITWNEIIELAKFADKLPKDRISTFVLNDDPTKPGGFLVTPSRELYGGAFVLVPFLNLESDKYAQIRAFVQIIIAHRFLNQEDFTPIHIRNGTSRRGLAGLLQIHLERYGFRIADVDNTENSESVTRIQYPNTPADEAAADLLSRFFSAEIIPMDPALPDNDQMDDIPASDSEKAITIILGSDYTEPFRIPRFSF